MGIWLSDGTFEPLFGEEREAFAEVLNEKLGLDAKNKFLELSDNELPEEVEMESYHDGYDDGYEQMKCEAEANIKGYLDKMEGILETIYKEDTEVNNTIRERLLELKESMEEDA